MSDDWVDSNIFVYAYEDVPSEPRCGMARTLLAELGRKGIGCTGVQNLSEFSNVCLKKKRMPAEEVLEALRSIRGILRILPFDESSVTLAVEATAKFQMQYFDALIWAVAKQNNVAEILTEDMPGGKTEIDGVRYKNPFVAQNQQPPK